MYNFCYLFNNLILHKPFKNKDLYDTIVDTLKHLQVHAIPNKYCYLNVSKYDYIVIFLTIYIKRGRGVLFTSHKNTTTAPPGGTYKLWNFYMPRSDTWRYINQKLFSNLAAEQKKGNYTVSCITTLSLFYIPVPPRHPITHFQKIHKRECAYSLGSYSLGSYIRPI